MRQTHNYGPLFFEVRTLLYILRSEIVLPILRIIKYYMWLRAWLAGTGVNGSLPYPQSGSYPCKSEISCTT